MNRKIHLLFFSLAATVLLAFTANAEESHEDQKKQMSVYLDKPAQVQCFADNCQGATPATEKLAVCLKQVETLTSERDTARGNEATIRKQHEALMAECKKPDKPASKPTVHHAAPPPPVVICVPPARLSADGKYCECDEGVSARLLSRASPWGSKVGEAACVPDIDMFRALRDDEQRRFAAICGGKTTEDCTEANKRLNKAFEFYKDLATQRPGSATPPLSWVTWDIVWQEHLQFAGVLDRLGKVEKDVADLKAHDKEQDNRLDNLESTKFKPFDFSLFGRFGYVGRPDMADSITASAEAKMTFWSSRDVGAYINGGLGAVNNSDRDRFFVDGRLGLAVALRSDHALVFNAGGVVTAEPALRGVNDALGLGGTIGLDAFLGGHFLIGGEFAMGAQREAIFTRVPGGQTRHLSDWGIFFWPNFVIGGKL